MNNYNFSHPHRMSPAAFFIIFMKTFKQSVIPCLTIAFIKLFDSSAIKNIGVGKIILTPIAICLAIAFLAAAFSYFPKKFYIKEGNLIFTHGLFNRETTSIPLYRVHSLRTRKGIWYRILDMRGIIFDTLATRQEEVELILDEFEWKRLLSIIDSKESLQTDSSDQPPVYNPVSTIRFPNKNLILSALCQNHLKGMAVLGSFLSIIFDHLADLPDTATDSAANFLEVYFDRLFTSPIKVIALFAIIYVFILILWIGRVMLRYSNMSMSHDKNLLTFSYGMFARNSCRFFYDKICTIRIKRNFLEKYFGLSTIMLRQALNASAQKEDDNLKIYGSDLSSFFLKWWLGSDSLDTPEIISAESGKGVFYRALLLPCLITIAACIIICHFHLIEWIFAPILFLLISVWRGILLMRHSRISLKDTYFIIRDGSFAKCENFIKYSDIEVVKIRRTPFTPRFHRVSLIISTSGTTFRIRSIKEKEAHIIYELLLLNN